MLNGLIKIQSLIRGYLIRKHKVEIIEERKRQIESDASSYNVSPIKTKIKKMTTQHTKPTTGSDPDSSDKSILSLSQSSLTADITDWRAFFTNQELNNAYNKLEKVSEAHSEEDHTSSDGGSSSDPSGDNLDMQEIIHSVYSSPTLK